MMFGNYRIVTGLILILISLLAVGCGTDKKIVAKVGDYEITNLEVNDIFQSEHNTFPSADEEMIKRKEILDSLIMYRLLTQAAYEHNINQLEELNRVVVANKDKLLLDVLYLRKIVDKAQVADTELRTFWEKIAEKVRASHILVDNLDTAKALIQRLQDGENFEKLAFDYSKDPSAKRNKGDLGYFLYGSMVKEFQDAAFAMEVGQISPPVKTKFGLHIIKLVDKVANEQRTDFESMRAELKEQLLNKKKMDLMGEYYEEIETKYPITIDTTTCNFLLRKREYLYPPQLLQTLPKNDFDVEQLDRNEKELVFATWDGGQMTILEYLEQAKQIPGHIKPNFDNYDSLKTIVFQIKRLELLTFEAVRSGFDKDDEYIRKMKFFKEWAMADIMRNDSLPKPLPPDDGMIRKYYEENLDQFAVPAKIHVYEILLSDELKAKKLAKELKTLNDFKSKAIDLTERPGKRPVQGNLDYIERRWFPEIFDLAKKTDIGKIGGPVVSQGKYSIFYVVDKVEQEYKDFLSVKNEITGLLSRQMKKEAFEKWIDERKSSTEIKVFEDALYTTIDQSKYTNVSSSKSN